MNRCFVVVEGPTDEELFRQLLVPNIASPVEFRVAGGWSAADSLGRSLLANGSGDVVVVVDADSVDPTSVAERKRFLMRSLEAIASPARRLVIVIEPELESLFFHNRQLLENLVGQPVSDTDFITGRYEPRKVLEKLLIGTSRLDAFRSKLPKLDLNPIRALPSIQQLTDFIQPVEKRAAA